MTGTTDWRDRLDGHMSERLATERDGGHDLGHLRRVRRNCSYLRRAEATASDALILVAGAYLHDLVNPPKDSADRRRASRRSAEATVTTLTDMGFSNERSAGVGHAIEAHSFSAGCPPETVEA
ncbi:MAG: hypothetical protein AAFX81_02340 [Pseudomonadota bacterium]